MSRKNFGSKPLLYPMPVLIIGTYNEDGSANAMNAAWGMISDFNEISISLSEHKTTENLRNKKAFTVSVATESQVIPCDYVGIVSGKTTPNKFEKAAFHEHKSEFVDAPIIEELPLTLECKVKSFEDGILIGEIINISVDESILNGDKIDVKKLKPIVFDPSNNTYMSLGEVVGEAFKDGFKLK